jgi:hypothetical protein
MFDRLITWVSGSTKDDMDAPRVLVDVLPRQHFLDGDVRELAEAMPAVLDQRPLALAEDAPTAYADFASLQFSTTGALRGDAARTRITEAFNAAQPVADRYALSGRYDELADLVGSVVDGNHHAFIYGARGVGKTSLARVFGDLVDEAGGDVFYHSASGDASFEEVMTPYLHFVTALNDTLGIDGRRAPLGPRFTARDVAEALSGGARGRIILILDEFDRIVDRRTRSELAAMLKLISDFRIGVQMILVGISTDIVTLMEEHPSLRRHMAAVRVGPIRPAGASGLLKEGARRAGVAFGAKCHDAIVNITLGSPYHVRLLALNAALAAHRQGRTVIDEDDLLDAIGTAWRDWSRLSLPSARLVGQLAKRSDIRLQLIVVALVAAHEYGFDEPRLANAFSDVLGFADDIAKENARDVIAMLGEVLENADGRTIFADALAPQFLLLAMLRADTLEEGFNLPKWGEAIHSANKKVQFDI